MHDGVSGNRRDKERDRKPILKNDRWKLPKFGREMDVQVNEAQRK